MGRGASPLAFFSFLRSLLSSKVIPLTNIVVDVSRHGKFRPTLMKLVSSNDPVLVENTVREAMSAYEEHDAAAALKYFTKLKGIGPATASLLLAVHDPKRVIFFADEAFYWLCCDGRKDPIKYNAKEYEALSENALALCQRLGVAAVDVERVAFVLLRQGGSPDLRSPAQSAVDKDPRQGKKAEVKSNTTVEKPGGRAAKRKAAPSRGAKPELNTSLRRSKRRTSPKL